MPFVIKKDGRVVRYIPEKILNNLNSIENVFDIKIKKNKKEIVNKITKKVNDLGEVSSKDLDRFIEEQLKDDGYVLNLFKYYKENEQEKFDRYTDIEHQLNKLEEKDPSIVNENGNKDSRTFVTQRDLTASIVAKAKGLQMYSEPVQRAHMKGLIHLHDLDRSPYQGLPNCSLPNFEHLLSNGFDIGTTHINQANSITVAVSHLSILISAITGEQYGGITVAEIDKLLAPYATKSFKKNIKLFKSIIDDDEQVYELATKETEKEVYDAMQSFEYEINTITAQSAQTPFVSISFGLSSTYWGKVIQESILKVRLKGMDDGKGGDITAIFPKLLYFVKDGHNLKPDDPYYDIKQLAMECSRKRIYPDMLSVDRLLELKGGSEPISPMGCRSLLHSWQRLSTHQEEVVGRNNIGVVSLNLPRIAIQSEHNIESFEAILKDTMSLIKDALHTREKGVLSADIDSAPIMYKQGGLLGKSQKSDIKTTRDIYTGDNRKRSTISVGYVGVYNTMVALTGDKKWYDNEDYYGYSVRILELIQKEIDDMQDEFEVHVSLYSTPSESLATRFAKLDKERFGLIKDVTSNEYYENSFHFPSNKKINPFDKIDFEEPYYHIANAGFISYVEQPNLDDNPKAFETIWNYAHEHLGYFGINSPNDSCFECDFEGEFNVDKDGYECPICGNRDGERMNVVRRLCGYLGQPSRKVIYGKQAEIANRKKHI